MLASHKNSKKHETTKKKLKDNNHFKVSHRQVVIFAVIGLIIINLMLLSAIYKIQVLTSQQNNVIALNESKTYSDITITVSDIQIETGYIMGIKPIEEEKIISVRLNITNNSDSDFEFYPTSQTFVRDNQGGQYIMTPVILNDPFVAMNIKPGESKSGQLSYLVTNRVVPLFLYIESRQSGSGPFVVKLQ